MESEGISILKVFTRGDTPISLYDVSETLPIARKRSFTFIAVLAEVSINNKLLSSAYAWASCKGWGGDAQNVEKKQVLPFHSHTAPELGNILGFLPLIAPLSQLALDPCFGGSSFKDNPWSRCLNATNKISGILLIFEKVSWLGAFGF